MYNTNTNITLAELKSSSSSAQDALVFFFVNKNAILLMVVQRVRPQRLNRRWLAVVTTLRCLRIVVSSCHTLSRTQLHSSLWMHAIHTWWWLCNDSLVSPEFMTNIIGLIIHIANADINKNENEIHVWDFAPHQTCIAPQSCTCTGIGWMKTARRIIDNLSHWTVGKKMGTSEHWKLWFTHVHVYRKSSNDPQYPISGAINLNWLRKPIQNIFKW